MYDSEWVKVGLADVTQPSGERFEHHIVWFPPPAIVAVFDDSGDHVLTAWRHRFAPDIWGWELPGGIIERDEAPEATAVREVEEETGYSIESVERLITFEPAVGMRRNPNHVFVARAGVQGSVTGPADYQEFDIEHAVFQPLTQARQCLRDHDAMRRLRPERYHWPSVGRRRQQSSPEEDAP